MAEAGLTRRSARKSRRSRARLAMAAAVAALWHIQPALAATDNWIGGSSDWNTAANWNRGVIPAAGDTVNVINTLGLTQTITYDYHGPSITLGSVTFSATGGTESFSMTTSGLTFSASNEFIGSSASGATLGGFGIVTQSAGKNSVSNIIYLGRNIADTGSYVLSGSGSLSAFQEDIGFSGTGNFNQSSGANTIGNSVFGGLYLGYNVGSTGTFSLSGSGLASNSASEYVGYNGTGIFNQSGGASTASQGLTLGYQTGSVGIYLLSGNGTLTVGASSHGEVIGGSGTGTFLQSGGTNSAGQLSIGAQAAGSAGTFSLAGGTVSASNVYVGGSTFAAGTGVLSVSGGQMSDAGALYCTSGSSINLSGGWLTVASLILSAGPSQLNWTAGTLGLTQNKVLTVGSGGLLGSSLDLVSGKSLVVSGSGGVNVTGMLSLDGGTLSTPVLNANGGSVNWNAGTINLTNSDLAVGPSALLGNAIVLDSTHYLYVSGNTSVGSGASVVVNGGQFLTGSISLDPAGTFQYNSGAFTFTNSDLTIGAGGLIGSTVTLNSGDTLNVVGFNQALQYPDTLTVTGTLNLNGGTLEVTSLVTSGGTFNWTTGALSLPANPAIIDSSATGNLGSSFTLDAAKSLSASYEQVGNNGTGTFYQTGGTNTVNDLLLGVNAGSTGRYLLSCGTLTCNFVEMIGSAGTGALIQSGGLNTCAEGLEVGNSLGACGTYVISGGTATCSYAEYIGVNGNGGFIQNGGANIIFQNELIIGYSSGSNGVYRLYAGTLACEEIIDGQLGAGVFDQTGGTDGALSIYVGGLGQYFLSGSGTVSSLGEGIDGSGVFTQTGGTNNTDELQVNGSDGNPGTYNLSAGTLSASVGPHRQEIIGAGGIVNQTGGLNIISPGGLFQLGNNPASPGTYNLSGTGILSINGIEEILVGSINQTGGINNIVGTSSVLEIGTNAGDVGTYALSGGTAAVAGSVYVSGFNFGPSGGTGILTVSNTGQLSVAGTLEIYSSGRVNLNVPNTAIGNLSISGNGILNLNGALTINYGSPASDPIAQVVSYLKSGYNGGNWTGTAGIISTSITGGSPLLSIGYADGNTDAGTAAGPNQIVIKYTLAGDSNLDGLVNFADLVAVIQNFNKSGADWAHGNFHYGASTGFQDLVAVIQNFNATLPPPSGSAVELGGSTLLTTGGSTLLTTGGSTVIQNTDVQLPEPSASAAIAAAFLLSRRRRRHKKENILPHF